MKIDANLLATGILLAITASGLGQPTITAIQLRNQPQTFYDSSHLYATYSVSLGAKVKLSVTASGTPPLHYQWQFNQSDLPGETNSTLNFPSVQLTNAGDYTVVVTNTTGATNRTMTLAVDPTFIKILTGPIATDAGFSAGGSWGDYNNDGFPDLFVFNGDFSGSTYLPFLYRNNGDGTFTKVTSGPPVSVPVESYSACWGDYDNNGNLDLYVATTGRNVLYHNNGDATFTRITTGSAVTDNANTWSAAWADYDNDGFLDLFVSTFNVSGAAHGFLYRNNGDGTFNSITNTILTTDSASSLACIWGDYDNDGYPHLFVCGGTGHSGGVPRVNRLYHNNGDGTFTRVTAGSIATDIGYSGNAAWGDYDNDGFLDLYVANLDIGGIGNFLYHNNGDGTFTRITNDVVATNVGSAYACAWGDYDNDGFLDLFVANRDLTPLGYPSALVNFLYHNNGDGTFSRVTNGSPANEFSDSWNCSWADYDNDGFLDLFVARNNQQGNFLYRNNGNSNTWLMVKLVGTLSNRSAIGAKVRVKATIGGTSRWQLRQITGGGGFACQNQPWANFGLGDATNIDLVRIEWPSGIVQTLTNVAPKQLVTVVEHQQGCSTHTPQITDVSRGTYGSIDLSVVGDPGLLYLFEASTNLVNWTWLGVRSNSNWTVQFSDLRATNYPSRFYRVSVP